MQKVDWTPLKGITPAKGKRGFSRFTEAEGERIIQFLRDADLPQTEVARYFGISVKIIRRMVIRETRYTRPGMPKAELLKVHRQHMAGRTVNSLAKELGIAPKTLSGRFSNAGLRVVCHHKRINDAEVEALLAQGLSYSQIARRLKCSAPGVQNARRRIAAKINQRLERTHTNDYAG